jgi:UDP-N-acetylmuramate--alanine ligase
VTNIDPEHLDYYGDMDRVRSAYLEFINRVPFYGLSVLCLDSVNVRSLLPQARKRVVTYGTTDDCDYVARDLCVIGMETLCEVVRHGEVLGTLRLRLPGRHHALNAIAAIAVAGELGVPFDVACAALTEFGGIHRRFELCGEAGGVMVISDYGHHPAEISASIATARERADGGRVLVIFRPLRYSRTRHLSCELARSLAAADTVAVADVSGASEPRLDGVSGKLVVDALSDIRPGMPIAWTPALPDAAAFVAHRAYAGDVVLAQGADDVATAAPLALEALR